MANNHPDPAARISLNYGLPGEPSTRKTLSVYENGILEVDHGPEGGLIPDLPYYLSGGMTNTETYTVERGKVRQFLDHFADEVGIGGGHVTASAVREELEVELHPDYTGSETWESATYDHFSLAAHPEAVERISPVLEPVSGLHSSESGLSRLLEGVFGGQELQLMVNDILAGKDIS